MNCAGIPSWSSFIRDRVSKGHSWVVLVPAEVWGVAVSPQIPGTSQQGPAATAALVGFAPLFCLEGKLFPNCKNTLYKAWSFCVLLVFLVKVVWDNLFHSGCSQYKIVINFSVILELLTPVAGWELLNCTAWP